MFMVLHCIMAPKLTLLASLYPSLKGEYQSILPWSSPKLITFSSITEMDIKDFLAISNLLIIDLYIDTTYAAFVFG